MTRRQPPAARRKAILDAAASLLVTNGLAGTSVDAVAQQAGIAKGTVYLYFASRSDLLAGLRSRYNQGLADRAGSILNRANPADLGSVAGAFERLAAELLDYVHANQRLYHVLFHEAPGQPRRIVGQVHEVGGDACRQAEVDQPQHLAGVAGEERYRLPAGCAVEDDQQCRAEQNGKAVAGPPRTRRWAARRMRACHRRLPRICNLLRR